MSPDIRMKIAAFDLETAEEVPEDSRDRIMHGGLGITCAAVAFSDTDQVLTGYGIPRMPPEKCRGLVRQLERLTSEGYTLMTWNGCGFDFAVLAQESGMRVECGELAMNHVDLMFHVMCEKGWRLSLEKALQGAGLEGKRKSVVLSDGRRIDDLKGAMAPSLWRAGEKKAVLSYLRGDVVQLLKLARSVMQTKSIRWTSNSGRPQSVRVDALLTVRHCLRIPEPDVSWMDAPPSREEFVNWIPNWPRYL